MGFYAKYVWAPILDLAMRDEATTAQRRKVVPGARGRVLEVGFGSGLNFPYYDPASVETITGLEPCAELQEKARKRAVAASLSVELVTGSAEDMPFDRATFDTVLVTWALCSIPDPRAALREMRRVLKPEGTLLFAEHGLASDERVARWQHRLNPVWRTVSGGCNFDRPIDGLVREASFTIERLNTAYLPGPKVLTYNYWGRAVPA